MPKCPICKIEFSGRVYPIHVKHCRSISLQDKQKENNDETEKFGKMTIEQLKNFSKEKGLEIPKEVTKKDDIIKYIFENLKVGD